MRTRGFTLIELLVALAIMAIVSAVAVLYQEYSIRTQRTNAERPDDLRAKLERLASAISRTGSRWPTCVLSDTSTAMYTITFR